MILPLVRERGTALAHLRTCSVRSATPQAWTRRTIQKMDQSEFIDNMCVIDVAGSAKEKWRWATRCSSKLHFHEVREDITVCISENVPSLVLCTMMVLDKTCSARRNP